MRKLYSKLFAAGLLGMAGSVMGAVNLPYANGFEGAFDPGASPWTSNGTVQTDSTLPKAGTQTCIVSNGSLALSITTNTYSNAWFQVWAKPVAGTNDPSVGAVSGAFYVNTNGKLRVYTGSWSDVGSGYPVNGSTWIGFAVHVDYINNTWDLYSALSGATMTKVATNLARVATGTRLASVSVQSGSRATIDQLALARGFTPVAASSSPAKVLAYEFPAGSAGFSVFQLPIYSTAYTNPAANKQIGGRLGSDLISGMSPADVISLSGGVDTYSASAGAAPAWVQTGASGLTRTVEPTDLLQLERDSASPVTFGFFPYDTAMTINGVLDGGAPPYQVPSIVLNGSSNFTAFNWPRGGGTLNAAPFPLRSPDAALHNGDRLWKGTASDPNRFDEFFWVGDETSGTWYNFAGPANAVFSGGANMWLRRANATAPTLVNASL